MAKEKKHDSENIDSTSNDGTRSGGKSKISIDTDSNDNAMTSGGGVKDSPLPPRKDR